MRYSNRRVAAATVPLFAVVFSLSAAVSAWGQTLPVTPPGPAEVTTEKRADICLNGVWRFAPSPDSVARPADGSGAWGAIRVPGDWRDQNGWPSVVTRGTGAAWKDYDGSKIARAWYEQTLTVPAAWQGRAVILDVGRVSTDADVLVDGRPAGRISWPYGTADLTEFVTPGKSHTIALRVVAATDAKEVLSFMETASAQVSTTEATLDTRGITGDVFLRSRPKGAHIDGLFVRTSVRKKELTVETELTDVTQAGTVAITARVLNPDGTEAKSFTGMVNAEAKPWQSAAVTWTWADPKLWEAGKPSLYRIVVTAKGAGVDDDASETFGFREFRVEGRKFLLNGTEIRLRPTLAVDDFSRSGITEMVAANTDDLMSAGFNFAECWPWNHNERGKTPFRELFAAVADQKGLLISVPTISVNPFVMGPGYRFIWDDKQKAEWERQMVAEWRRYRNHPSVVMFTPSANFFGYNNDQDPRLIGRAGYTPNPGWKRNADAGREAVALLKKYDPTRPVFTHQGADVGDVFAVNHYMDMLPLQDVEEWMSDWATNDASKFKAMPYIGIEFMTPFMTTMHRGRNGYGPSISSEPLMTEFAAAYLGQEAYRTETPEYRKRMRDSYKGGQEYDGWHETAEMRNSPAFQRLQSLYTHNIWRSWRTMGVTGGMIPWSDGHGWQAGPKAEEEVPLPPFLPGRRGGYLPAMKQKNFGRYSDTDANQMLAPGRALVENNGPTLAWITGPKAAFTDKSHNFRAGATVAKSVALLNDTRDTQPYTLTWTASAAGKTAATKTVSGKIAPSETAFVPISFATPGATTVKTDGKIMLAATIGGRAHRDSFDFRVFPKQPARRTVGGESATTMTIYAFDPAGETTALLKSLGYAVRPWNGDMPAKATVVIGRKALSSVPLDEANRRLAALRSYVAKGGRALLMAQDPDWMRTYFGLRVSGILTRRTFPVTSAHPALAGLDATDLRDWTGESRLVVARPDYVKTEHAKAPSGSPYWGWRWGARHVVSSAAVEKPHRTGWRPLLECEFDLAYSPLMTLDYGKGTLTLCTLDLEDHVSADPAAAKLATQMLHTVTTTPSAPRKESTLLIGAADSDRKLLDGVGVRYKESTKLPPPGGDALVLVGSGQLPDAAALEAFARAGGAVLVLPRPATAADPLGARREVREGMLGATTVPQWQETRGLSVSDLRWRNEAGATVLVGGNGVEVGANGFLGRRKIGKGVILFCQIDPTTLDVDARTYYRLSRWRQTRAFAQVAANLGASFDQDNRIFVATAARADVVPLGGAWKIQVTQKLPAAPSPDQLSADPGVSPAARALLTNAADESKMRTMNLPGSVTEFTESDGEAVVRRVIEVPVGWAGKDLELSLGAVDDADETYWNGTKVGGSTGYNVPRNYVIPAAQVKAGRNVIAVRVFDNFGGGGFSGTVDQLSLRPAGKAAAAKPTSLYHPDYREDFDLGDDPYRYYRW